MELNSKIFKMKNTLKKMKSELKSIQNKKSNYSFQGYNTERLHNLYSNDEFNINKKKLNKISLQKRITHNELKSIFDSNKKNKNANLKFQNLNQETNIKDNSFYNNDLISFTNINDDDYYSNRDKNNSNYINFKKNISSKNINSHRSYNSYDYNRKKESNLYYDYNTEPKSNRNYKTYYEIINYNLNNKSNNKNNNDKYTSKNNNQKISKEIKNILNNYDLKEILFKSNAFEKNSNLLIQNYKKQYGTYNNNIEDFYYYLKQKIGRDYYYKKELNLYRQLYEKLIKITDKKDIEEIKILINIQSKDKKNENYMKKIKKILNNT